MQARSPSEPNLACVPIDLKRGTMKGIENVGKVTIADNEITDKPLPSERYAMMTETEARHLNAQGLEIRIRALPRHNNNQDSVVKSTQESIKGPRVNTTSFELEPLRLIAFATNSPPENANEWDGWKTLRFAVSVMVPGGNKSLKKRKLRNISDTTFDNTKMISGFPSDANALRRIDCALCTIPQLVRLMAIGNDLGLTSVECDPMKLQMFNWYIWFVDTYFKWLIFPNLRNGIQRIAQGAFARNISVGIWADLLAGLSAGDSDNETSVDSAIARVSFKKSLDAVPLYRMVPMMHGVLRSMIDNQVVWVQQVVSDVLKIPLIPFDYMIQTMRSLDSTEYDPSNSMDFSINGWLTGLVSGFCFLPADLSKPYHQRTNIDVYVSTPANLVSQQDFQNVSEPGSGVASGFKVLTSPAKGTESMLRFMSGDSLWKGYNSIGNHLNTRSAAVTDSSDSMSLLTDPDVLGNAVEAYCKTKVGLQLLAGDSDVLDADRWFRRFNVACPERFKDAEWKRESRAGISQMGYLFQASIGESERVQGVKLHVVQLMMLQSLCSLSIQKSKFHGNMNSLAAQTVMECIVGHSPKSTCPGDGVKVALDNYLDAGSELKQQHLSVEYPDNEYFLRATNDRFLVNQGECGFLSSPLKPFAFEDLLHLPYLGIMKQLKISRIDEVPASDLFSDPELLCGRLYPIVTAGAAEGAPEPIGCICLGRLAYDGVSFNAVYADHDGDIEKNFRSFCPGVENAVSILWTTDGLESFESARVAVSGFGDWLRRNSMTVFPLVSRVGALVLLRDKSLGLIVPRLVDETRKIRHFLGPDLNYLVVRESGAFEFISFLDTENMLVAIGTPVFVPFESKHLDPYRGHLAPPLNRQPVFVEMILRYPDRPWKLEPRCVSLVVNIHSKSEQYCELLENVSLSDVYLECMLPPTSKIYKGVSVAV